jgi:hypothetical protein
MCILPNFTTQNLKDLKRISRKEVKEASSLEVVREGEGTGETTGKRLRFNSTKPNLSYSIHESVL